jgi:hypothetical protein
MRRLHYEHMAGLHEEMPGKAAAEAAQTAKKSAKATEGQE